MKLVCGVVLVVSALITVPTASADSAGEKRLTKALSGVEADVKKLDDIKADRTLKIDVRILALDKRIASQEKARKLKIDHVKLGKPGTLSNMATRSAAIAQMATRVRRIKKHDKPPAVTPPSKGPKSKDEAKPEPKPKKDSPVEWPEGIEVTATASLDYTQTGEWLYGSTARSRLRYYEYFHTGYDGHIHFSVRLSKLVRQVKSVDFTIFVTGRTGPFKITEPVRYDITWNASNRRMGNGAVKNWHAYDQWSQSVLGVWVRGPKQKNIKPRVEAHLTRVVTDKGRVVEFSLPKKYR